jgi:hypothetical protein
MNSATGAAMETETGMKAETGMRVEIGANRLTDADGRFISY